MKLLKVMKILHGFLFKLIVVRVWKIFEKLRILKKLYWKFVIKSWLFFLNWNINFKTLKYLTEIA